MIRLYDTLEREKREFDTAREGKKKLKVIGQ